MSKRAERRQRAIAKSKAAASPAPKETKPQEIPAQETHIPGLDRASLLFLMKKNGYVLSSEEEINVVLGVYDALSSTQLDPHPDWIILERSLLVSEAIGRIRIQIITD